MLARRKKKGRCSVIIKHQTHLPVPESEGRRRAQKMCDMTRLCDLNTTPPSTLETKITEETSLQTSGCNRRQGKNNLFAYFIEIVRKQKLLSGYIQKYSMSYLQYSSSDP